MKKYLIIFILAFISQFGFAQKQGRDKIDSLQNELNHSNSDTGQINNWILLAGEFITIFPDSGIYYGNLALDKTLAIKNNTFQIASLLALGSNYSKMGNQPKALSSYSKALELSNETNDSLNIARSYTGLSVLYIYLGDLAKSTNYIELALAINQRLNNKYEIARCFLTIGSIYSAKNQFKEAVQFNEKALAAALESNNKKVVAYSYSNSAIAFTNMKQFDKALRYQFTALKVEEEMGDKYGIATEYSSISEAYSGLSDSAQGVKKNALLDSAIHYSNLGINLSYQCNIPRDRIFMLNSLGHIYENKKEYKQAFELLKHANALKDSVFSDASNKEVQKIEIAKAMLVKENEIEIQKLQLSKSKQLQLGMIIGIALLLGSIFFIYKSFMRQRSVNKKLKETQTQLIQQEKLASLGELTAGIAHEIQNPLNFVNNFSEVNKEMLVEMNEEIEKGNLEEVKAIARDVIENEEKINHHGKRADAIVKGMLQHSRSSNGEKTLTDINALADEYLRLSYHGLRAKDKYFNADFKLEADESVPKINVVPQDIGRILINLINNAFYAVSEKAKQNENNYKPEVVVSTKKLDDKIEIRVRDNGNGIPAEIKDKIFQPFFTTKPTGEGTGLGLSLSYDIIKAHGGDLKVESEEEQGSVFIIKLPV